MLFFCLNTLSAQETTADSFSHLSIEELKRKIESTQDKLDQLPLRLIRESGGTLGIRPFHKHDLPHKLWVEVNLQKPQQFDTIVIVPAVMIDEHQTSSNFGFPKNFQIRCYADSKDNTGTLLYDSTITPLTPFPNQSPILIDCPNTSAQRVRFIPLDLIKSTEAPHYFFALSELLIFNKQQNLALGRPVHSPQSTRHYPIWGRQYLTDGYMPYSEPSIRTKKVTNYCRIFVPSESQRTATITLDLGRKISLDEIRLYPVHMDQNFVVFHRSALGFPKKFKLEVASDPSFRNPTLIYDTKNRIYPSPGDRMASFAAKGATGRFVRLTALELQHHPRKRGFLLSLAEFEVIAQGMAISKGAKVSLSHATEIKRFPAAMLADGVSDTGTIMPMRTWLSELAERNRLESELSALHAAQKTQFLKQSQMIQALQWAVGITLLIALVAYFWQRFIRQRQIYQLRENLAADLHDEIGGNFSGIALLSDELTQEPDMPKHHLAQLINIAEISRASASDARSLVRFLESRNVTGELLQEMRYTAEILLSAHQYHFEVKGNKYVSTLEPKDKWHLLLFFKEALNNIVKHAHASEVHIKFHLTPRQLTLTIHDNGCGLNSTLPFEPAHLTMRAHKLKASLDFSTPPNNGTLITLRKKL
ncbi:ATP-binding protein [Rubritalea spongiae]|uniref:ATP-binding protein n=1 Tax=Rubritalea spongiae TaxID=430797 RepID=A0ABW5E155_9BACT